MTPPRLLPPGAYTGFLGALCVPDDLYWVSRTPVVIAGMAYPGRADWAQLHAEGVGHVVCLTPRCGSLRRVAVHRDRVPAAGSRERRPTS